MSNWFEAELIDSWRAAILTRWCAGPAVAAVVRELGLPVERLERELGEPLLVALAEVLRRPPAGPGPEAAREQPALDAAALVAPLMRSGLVLDRLYALLSALRAAIGLELIERGLAVGRSTGGGPAGAPPPAPLEAGELVRYLERLLALHWEPLATALLRAYDRSLDVQRRERDEYFAIIDHHVLAAKTDPAGRITWVSEAFLKASGYRRAELIGQGFERLRHPSVPPALFSEMWSVISSGKGWWGEFPNRTASGGEFWLRTAITPLRDEAGTLRGYMSIGHDVSARRAAVTDPLTGAANRIELDEVLARELGRLERHGTPCSVIMLDLDHFKRINDTFGHQAGDELLREVTERVREQLRERDVLVRYGGEEFVVLLPGTELSEALRVAERLRQAVARQVLAGGQPQTISLGVTQAARGEPAERLIHRADVGLYAAKRAGRNRVVCETVTNPA